MERLSLSNQLSFMNLISFKSCAAAASVVVFCVLVPTNCYSVEKPVGPFAFVNAVDSAEPTFVYLNGDSYRPRGYSVGQMTFGARTYSGSQIIKVENKELGSDSITVPITETYCPIIIAYAHQTEGGNGEKKRQIKLTTLPSKLANNGAFSVFYASNMGQVPIEVDSQVFTVEASKLLPVADKRFISYRLPSSDGAPRRVAPEVATHIVLVIFDLKDGSQVVAEFEDVSSE